MASDSPVIHADKILWKTNDPVWIDQWPLSKEKLLAARELVQEQLQLGHIEISTSPWNSPIFVIKKKSGKWRLLQDLRAVNKTMYPMGALQPGLPHPMAIPAKYYKLVIDLKDCFYTIPLHPEDCKRFAFSVPSVNLQEPMERYQWKVLPQGMANSPTLCQKFVAQAIKQVRMQYPDLVVIHYMDDILMAAEDSEYLTQAYGCMQKDLKLFGLKIAEEKIQRDFPYKYLGFQLYPKYFLPQKLAISITNYKTLNDFQKLLGDINWIRPSLKLTTQDLSPLFQILQGDSDPSSPRNMTHEGRVALKKVEQAIEQARLNYADITKPWSLIILPTSHTPTGVLYQSGVLYWIHGSHSQSSTLKSYPVKVAERVQTGRKLSLLYLGHDPHVIILPYKDQQITWLLNMVDEFACALANFSGQVSNVYPQDKVLSFSSCHPFVFPKVTKFSPIANATVVYTDGSSNGRAVLTDGKQQWCWQLKGVSAQMAELYAVYQAFIKFSQALNIYTDSLYIVQALQWLEVVPVIQSKVSYVQQHLSLIQSLLTQRQYPCFIGHIRSHSGLPGPLSEGNNLADCLTKLVAVNLEQAIASHALHHQSAKTLRQQFKLTREQARGIVKQCSSCAPLLPVPHYGVNPRGLLPNDLWQMDVTHIPQFGKLSYVHVTIDTYSHFVMASALSGEKASHVCTHLLTCFSILGIPKVIKTDNGPAYVSTTFKQFCSKFNIVVKTGIPYNPQGQGIVEKANHLLKTQLRKQKGGIWGIKDTPKSLLAHSLFVLNFLNLDDAGLTAADRHWNPTSTAKPLVYWRDPMDNSMHGPDPVLVWGRGYVCVFPTDAPAPRWLPARCVRHAENKNRKIEKKDVSPDLAEDGAPEEGSKEDEGI